MLWLALTFPKLPLEAQSERTAARQTAAGAFVVERGHVCVVEDVAEAAGVVPGMRLSTARSLLPEARMVDRDAAAIGREQQALDALSCFAGSVTPGVCIERPGTLLLDIGGCLRLFGGIAPIVDHLRRGCAERGVSVRLGIAPTPRGAQWLAQLGAVAPADRSAGVRQSGSTAGTSAEQSPAPHAASERPLQHSAWQPQHPGFNTGACCLTLEALPDMLARLPIDVLLAGPDVAKRLRAFGARKIGDLMALPRASLARRIGPEPVGQLLQALGELPDPRAPVVFPEYFRHRIELPAPASDADMLGFPARRLIVDLCGWLAARQLGATRCMLVFVPERRGLPVQRLELRLSTASRDPARFQRLLRERLDRMSLAAPIAEVSLEAGAPGEVIPLPGHSASLLDTRQPTAPLDVLIERLRGRLGESAVHGLRVHPAHRPECATLESAVGFADAAIRRFDALRPLTLLDPPEALGERNGRPVRCGEPLELVSGPERIESGWWDGGELTEGSAGMARRGPGEMVELADFVSSAAVVGSGACGPLSRRDDISDHGACSGFDSSELLGAGAGSGPEKAARPAPGDVRRDYFFARSRHGECWWIFRDAAGWWAHGVGLFAA